MFFTGEKHWIRLIDLINIGSFKKGNHSFRNVSRTANAKLLISKSRKTAKHLRIRASGRRFEVLSHHSIMMYHVGFDLPRMAALANQVLLSLLYLFSEERMQDPYEQNATDVLAEELTSPDSW